MKKKIFAALLGGTLLASALGACADLGFGIDVDDGYASPYWYGGGPVYSPWDWGGFSEPLYGPGWGIGPSIGLAPRPPRPPRPDVRPPQLNPPVVNPTPSRPTFSPGTVNPGGMERPGNMGLPEGEVPINRGRR